MTPTSIGKYTVVREIGKGAFGIVYEGYLESDPEQRVAIKLLEKSSNVERQLAEPELLAKLKHPNIVRLRDYFVEHQQLVIVLDYVPGGDLKSALENGRSFTQAEVRELLQSMASALALAHRHSIVHRDIKFANIMLDDTGEKLKFVLTDFGIGRVEDGVQDRPNTGGTMLFMAPEQFRGRPSPQSDLWALGVVAYRLLSGKMPFQGTTLPELSRSILYLNPIAPSVVTGRGGDEKLDLIVMQLLEKSLNERVASADELVQLISGSGKHKVSAGQLLQTGGSLILESGSSLLQALSPRDPKDSRPTSGMDALIRRMNMQKAFAIGLGLFFVVMIALGAGPIRGPLKLLGLSLFFYSQTGRSKHVWTLLTCSALALLFTMFDFDQRYQTNRQRQSQITSQLTDTLSQQIEPSPVMVDNNLGTQSNLQSTLEEKIENAIDKSLEEKLGQDVSTQVESPSQVKGILDAISRISYPLLALAIAAHRRINRKAFNLALLTQDTTSPATLESMRLSVAERPNDILFRMKYVEALLAAGRLEDVVVECQLVVEIDPYHFNANLILANALLELGLLDDAAQVCQAYLAVSGYCFEFQIVLERCRNLGVVV